MTIMQITLSITLHFSIKKILNELKISFHYKLSKKAKTVNCPGLSNNLKIPKYLINSSSQYTGQSLVHLLKSLERKSRPETE